MASIAPAAPATALDATSFVPPAMTSASPEWASAAVPLPAAQPTPAPRPTEPAPAPAPAGAAAAESARVRPTTGHTFADAVHSVHRMEHGASAWLPYEERVAAAEQLYAAVTTVATAIDAKVAAAVAAKRAAANKTDAKFAAAVAAHKHSASHDAYGGNTGSEHSYAPPVSATELQRFRLELTIGAAVTAEDVPRSGDKLSSSFFTGTWRRATLRWGPPSASGKGALVPEVHVIWPKTQAQVAAALHGGAYPSITNPTGMWLLREPNGEENSTRFYVVDGAYRAAYLLDPNNKPPYSITWSVWVIENDPKFAFWVNQWNPKTAPAAAHAGAATNRATASATATKACRNSKACATACPAVVPAAGGAVAATGAFADACNCADCTAP